MPPKVKKVKKGKKQKGGAAIKSNHLVVPVAMPMHGEGFFGDLWDGVKKVGGFLKDSKILSGVASAIPHPYAQTAAPILKQIGLGKRKKLLKL